MVLALAIVLAGAGCATSGRYVALKEFSPPRAPDQNSPLNGRAICVKPFVSAFSINDKLQDEKAVEPPNYSYVKLTKEETELWDKEVDQRKKTSTKKDWLQIGYVRNMVGIVMSKVYALNDPGVWLTDTLKANLQSLGARLIDTPQEADAEVSVRGTIKYFKVDMYMTYAADLVVDVELKPRTKAVMSRSLHTKAGKVAWSGSSFEFYQSLRECQQKFLRLVIADIEQLLKD
jgi:hypothetical protein